MRVRPYVDGDAVATWQVFHTAVRRTTLAGYTPAQVAAWVPDDVDADWWAASGAQRRELTRARRSRGAPRSRLGCRRGELR